MRDWTLIRCSKVRSIILGFLVMTPFCLFLVEHIAHADSRNKNIIIDTEKNGQTRQEPVTFMLRGELISLQDGLYSIRDNDGVETTIAAKKVTTIHGRPKVGDRVDVEYLENGTALIIMVIPPKEGS